MAHRLPGTGRDVLRTALSFRQAANGRMQSRAHRQWSSERATVLSGMRKWERPRVVWTKTKLQVGDQFGRGSAIARSIYRPLCLQASKEGGEALLDTGAAQGVMPVEDRTQANGKKFAGESTPRTAFGGGSGTGSSHGRAADELAHANRGPLPSPREIVQGLDDAVVGQDHAKKVLSVAAHNHYQRLRQRQAEEPPENMYAEIEKSNVLMLGPTGSGKTHLARTLASQAQVPFAQADATTLTQAGYVGEDVESVLQKLLNSAGGDMAAAQQGIVYIDEVDKLARKGDGASKDVGGEGVQQALLGLLEGTVATVPEKGARKSPRSESVQMDTRDILFVVGGAFVGIERFIMERTEAASLGFTSPVRNRFSSRPHSDLLHQVESADLLSYGLIPEFCGRLPIVCPLGELTENELVRVLWEPRNALGKQFAELFRMNGVRLTLEQSGLRAIAQKAKERGVGARGLRSLLESVLREAMFEAPSGTVSHVRVDDASVHDGRAKMLYAPTNAANAGNSVSPAFEQQAAEG